jgi:ribosomal protein L14E/L6E/L27E
MEISKSDIILSVAGRDAGKLFYVIDTDGVYVLLANGKERKLENPKRKKLKHVRRVSRTETRVAEKLRSGDKVLNSELRRDLAKISQEFICQNQGG